MIIQKSLACVKLEALLGHISNHLSSLILSSGVYYLQVNYTHSMLNQNFIEKKITFQKKIYLLNFLKIGNEQ